MEQLFLEDQSPVWTLGSLMSRRRNSQTDKSFDTKEKRQTKQDTATARFRANRRMFCNMATDDAFATTSLCNFYKAFDKKGLGHSFVFSYR